MRKLMYLMIGLFILSCSTEQTEEFAIADLKANKAKPQRSVYLKPSINNLRAFNGRILQEPVEYTGDFDLSDVIDFDNDGVTDNVVLNQRCYFPRTFVEVLVNGEVVSYSVSYSAKILGFKDVNLDGFTDVVFEGGSANAYNNGEAYRPYNVAYNVEGNVIPLKDIVQSLVITSVDPNPEYIKWDLSEYGIHNFTFHVFLFNKNLSDAYGYEQTHTYGEFGFYSLNRITVGQVYVLRFTNLGDDCTSIDVEFTL